MVSDANLGLLIVGVLTLAGAFVGLLAEPVRAYFKRKAHQKQLRRTLYGELFIKLERVLKGYAVDYGVAIRSKNIDYLKSANKLEIAGPISFPDEVAVQAQYFQLTSQELDLLAVAYYRLRFIINKVHKFGSTSFDTVDDAKKEYTTLEESLKFSLNFINKAFEDNARILEKLDEGILLKKWRKLMQDFPQYLQNHKDVPSKKEKKKKPMLKH